MTKLVNLAPTELTIDDRIDQLELAMLQHKDLLVDFPLVHRFTPGMYIREIFMPAGSILTSFTHLTEHPFVITQGIVSVYIENEGMKTFTGPYVGVTQAGTRRVLMIHEDTTWLTFHVNADNCTNIDTLETRITERRELPDGTTVNERYREIVRPKLLNNTHNLPVLEDYIGAP